MDSQSAPNSGKLILSQEDGQPGSQRSSGTEGRRTLFYCHYFTLQVWFYRNRCSVLQPPEREARRTTSCTSTGADDFSMSTTSLLLRHYSRFQKTADVKCIFL